MADDDWTLPDGSSIPPNDDPWRLSPDQKSYLKGDKGDTGDKGEKGDQGDVGPPGPQGLIGLMGLKGDKGDKGNTGDIGPAGDKGDTGATGPIGAASTVPGPAGPQGIQGIQGVKGDTGAAGPASPGQRNLYRYLTTAGQMVVTGASLDGPALAYTPGQGFLDVLRNGTVLDTSEYTATDGTSIVFPLPLGNDDVRIYSFVPYTPANVYTQAQSDAQYARRFNVMAKTAAYPVTTADAGKLIACSGTWALTLPSAAAAANGFAIEVSNTGTGKITATPNGTDTINGAATLVINQKESGILVSDGAGWQAIGFAPVIIYAGTGVNDYRKWSNGWTEQWGVSPGQTADRVVTFPIPFTSIQKMPRGTIMTAASSVAVIYGVHIDSLTVNNFILRARYMSNNGGVVVGAAGENVNWSCEGYS